MINSMHTLCFYRSVMSEDGDSSFPVMLIQLYFPQKHADMSFICIKIEKHYLE